MAHLHQQPCSPMQHGKCLPAPPHHAWPDFRPHHALAGRGGLPGVYEAAHAGAAPVPVRAQVLQQVLCLVVQLPGAAPVVPTAEGGAAARRWQQRLASSCRCCETRAEAARGAGRGAGRPAGRSQRGAMHRQRTGRGAASTHLKQDTTRRAASGRPAAANTCCSLAAYASSAWGLDISASACCGASSRSTCSARLARTRYAPIKRKECGRHMHRSRCCP
jgi:hypothetical protein